MVLHRLLFLVVPVGSRGENPFRLAIYLGHWWPGQPLREGIRIVGGRLWLPSADAGLHEVTLERRAAPTREVIQVRGREVASPAPT